MPGSCGITGITVFELLYRCLSTDFELFESVAGDSRQVENGGKDVERNS